MKRKHDARKQKKSFLTKMKRAAIWSSKWIFALDAVEKTWEGCVSKNYKSGKEFLKAGAGSLQRKYKFDYTPESKVTQEQLKKAKKNLLLSAATAGIFTLITSARVILGSGEGTQNTISLISAIIGISGLLFLTGILVISWYFLSKQKPGINKAQQEFESRFTSAEGDVA